MVGKQGARLSQNLGDQSIQPLWLQTRTALNLTTRNMKEFESGAHQE